MTIGQMYDQEEACYYEGKVVELKRRIARLKKKNKKLKRKLKQIKLVENY